MNYLLDILEIIYPEYRLSIKEMNNIKVKWHAKIQEIPNTGHKHLRINRKRQREDSYVIFQERLKFMAYINNNLYLKITLHKKNK